MDTAVVIVVASIVVASIAFLAFGQRAGPKATDKADESRWAAQATFAEMRKEGGGLPSEVGEEANRNEGPPVPNWCPSDESASP